MRLILSALVVIMSECCPGAFSPARLTRKMQLRPALASDIPVITAIYAHYVEHTTSSFDTKSPSLADMEARLNTIQRHQLPFLVASVEDRVIGYAYAAQYRPRLAYRFTVEDSIYLHPEYTGKGVGRALLSSIIDICTAAGYRQMVAVIGDSANAASIGLHGALGFRMAGVLESAGWKFNRWVDSVLMQRALGAGNHSHPPT